MDRKQAYLVGQHISSALAIVHESIFADAGAVSRESLEQRYREGFEEGGREALEQVHPAKALQTALDATRAELAQAGKRISRLRDNASRHAALADDARVSLHHYAARYPAPVDYSEKVSELTAKLAEAELMQAQAFDNGKRSVIEASPTAAVTFNRVKDEITGHGGKYKDITVTIQGGTSVLVFIRKAGYITPKLYVSPKASDAETCSVLEACLGLPLFTYGADRK